MALMQPKKPKVGGVVPGSLVARGGQVGRPATLHMGIAAHPGGMNGAGSLTRSVSVRGIGGGLAGSRGIGTGVKPFTPPRPKPATVKPLMIRPASPTVAPPAPEGPPTLDPSAWHDSTYNTGMLQMNHDQGLAATSLADQLGTLKSQYTLGRSDLDRWHQQDAYNSNANLASHGILFSGSEHQATTDRANQYAQKHNALDNDYGALAQARVQAQISDMPYQTGLATDALDAEAYQRFLANNPTWGAPEVAAAPAAPSARAVAVPAKKPVKKPAVKAPAKGGGVSKVGTAVKRA